MSSAKRAILDTSAILDRPEVLAHTGHGRLVIPEMVFRELTRAKPGRQGDAIGALIQQATARGAKIVSGPGRTTSDSTDSESLPSGVSDADLGIVRIAADYVQRLGSSSVVVVTQDQRLRGFLSSKGMNALSAAEFLQESTEEPADLEILKSAKAFSLSQRRFVVFSVLLGLASSILGNFIYGNLSYLVATVSVWGTLVALPALGILLYWCRQRYRLLYGVFEFAVGMSMAYYVFFPVGNYSKLTVVQGIQIVGGLYVMVRGLDNIGKGVEGTRAGELWNRWFS
jgi:rRNA-processing protein FCF1